MDVDSGLGEWWLTKFDCFHVMALCGGSAIGAQVLMDAALLYDAQRQK